MTDSFYNSEFYFDEIKIAQHGFREYDVRWMIQPVKGKPADLNFRGFMQLGNWLGRFLQLEEHGAHQKILVAHDFRSYSENTKNALTIGLLASGLDVLDAGLALTPICYYGQYETGIKACAMVTASHNDNGWTGVKIGYDLSRTFGYEKMRQFEAFAKEQGQGIFSAEVAGRYAQMSDLRKRYEDAMVAEWEPRLQDLPPVRVAVETGNGTAGVILPQMLRRLGFDVVEGNVKLDWDFPNFNPNPESVPFLKSVKQLVLDNKADLGVCIDGDGDRLGVVLGDGEIVFSDRVGMLIGRKMEAIHGAGSFVVDVKSTSLYNSQLQSKIIWEKTGHSYIKAAVAEHGATAGFERSGHFFFTPPYGKGYDDACVSALMMLWVAAEAKSQEKTLTDYFNELPASHQSPNRQPTVPELRKYEIVDEIKALIEAEVAQTSQFSGQEVAEVITINGVRLRFADDSWLLVRASSNAPVLVIIAESFDEDGSRLEQIDTALRMITDQIADMGDYEFLHQT